MTPNSQTSEPETAAESSGETPPREQAARKRARPLLRFAQLGTLALVAGLLGLLVWKVVERERGPNLVKEIRVGKMPPAPGFDLSVIWPHSETWPPMLRRALADGKVSPAELNGRPLVINFWASWCIPCRHEAPHLAASARAHAGRVAFLGIDVEDLRSDARRFLRRYRVNYVSVRDGGGSTYDDYGLTGVPETYWIDARGRIVAHYAGQVSRQQLEQGIALTAAEASR
jgi:cytochrome c biogenesis protein CcmG, thiol:disulfide interchange protein DsbE